MIFPSCIHTHTCFCDGKDLPEVMAQAAFDLGFVSLGFAGHSIWKWFDEAMTDETQAEYRRRILALKDVYNGKMDILLGVEHEGCSEYDDLQWDFIIESIHDLPFGDRWYSIDWTSDKTDKLISEFCGGDPYSLAKQYFETCSAVYEHSPAQIAGHIDLITKYNEGGRLLDETDPRYLNPALEALETAVRRGLVVELNTGAMARGYRSLPYPGPALLKRLRELGGEITINSDCHDSRYLTCWYEHAAEYLRSFGFDHILLLRKTGWQELGL